MVTFKRLYLFVALPMIFTSGCYNQTEYHTKKETQKPSNNVPKAIQQVRRVVTVWVHGTLGLSRTLMPNFFRSIKGLQKVQSYNPENNLFEVAHTLNHTDPQGFPLKDLYIFGWSGELDAHARKVAAQELLAALHSLVERYRLKDDGIKPYLRVITHSHGGKDPYC